MAARVDSRERSRELRHGMKRSLFRIAYWTLHCVVGIMRKWRVPKNCKVIGVTGSCGKTLTKDLIAAILSTRYPGTKSNGTFNTVWEAARLLFSFDPKNRFYVQEVATYSPGMLASFVRVLRPDVGVVTTIGWDHYRSFRGPDAVAREKSALIEILPQDGMAVLNADDSRALAMRENTMSRVFTFGLGESATLRAFDVSSAWPERLSFTLLHEGRKVRVNTRLCGEYLVHNVLAALAVGVAFNIPLENSVKAVERIEPYLGRMQPVKAPGGIWFIRDDWKAPYWTIGAFLDFVKKADARRKIIVFGNISDRPGTSRSRYRDLIIQGLSVADKIVLIGSSWNLSIVKKIVEEYEKVILFHEIHQASEFFDTILQTGDLVVLKGSGSSHLGRLVLSRFQVIDCWKSVCKLKTFCEDCRHL